MENKSLERANTIAYEIKRLEKMNHFIQTHKHREHPYITIDYGQWKFCFYDCDLIYHRLKKGLRAQLQFNFKEIRKLKKEMKNL